MESRRVMNKILTITVPTYNIEKYINKCLSSLVIPEILDDIEVLIVNDGSKDTSVEIAENYESKYPNTFKIINKENGGHGSTINRGIQEASGAYFKVIDGDDWVDKAAFINLINCLKKTTSDIVMSNFYWINDNTGKIKAEFTEPFTNVVYNKEYTFKEVSDKIFIKMHAMTIRTSILKNNIPPIDEHCFYVDMEYVLFPIPYVKTITCIEDYVYMYRVGLPTQSMNTAKLQKNESNYEKVLNRVLLYYSEQKNKGIDKYYLKYFENTIARMIASRIKIFLSFPYSKDIQRKIKKFDTNILNDYPSVYKMVRNKAVIALRKSNYRLYFFAQLSYKALERLKA